MLEITQGYTRCPYKDGPLAYLRETEGGGTRYGCRSCGYEVVRYADGSSSAIPDDLPDDDAPDTGPADDPTDRMAEYLYDGTVDGDVYDGDPADLDWF